ncbi:hypothetical protein J6590_075235 [Homalodisca vitripennis]|nr:hypothetical protein J6590_075235 [Homalodisca vitripennis]
MRENFRRLTFNEKEFLAKVKELDSPIPKALSLLAGIGSRDPRILRRCWTHHPTPLSFISLHRSLCAAHNLAGVVDWDLPQGVRSQDANAIHPNINKLGCAPSVHLSPEQLAFLSKVGITQNAFPMNNGSIPLNIPLILAVQRELAEVKGINLSPFPNVTVRSTGQIVN